MSEYKLVYFANQEVYQPSIYGEAAIKKTLFRSNMIDIDNK